MLFHKKYQILVKAYLFNLIYAFLLKKYLLFIYSFTKIFLIKI